MVAEFPWAALAKVDRRTSRVIAALTAWRGVRRPGGWYLGSRRGDRFTVRRAGGEIAIRRDVPGITDLGGLRIDGAAVLGGIALHQRLADPTAGVVVVRAGELRGFVVAPGVVARAMAQAVLGGPDELAAPRPLTPAERAVLVVGVAAALGQLGLALQVGPSELGGPQVPEAVGGEAAVIELVIEAPELAAVASAPARLALVVPLGVVLAPPRPPLAALAATLPCWLDDAVSVPVVVGATRLDRAAVAALRPRDVVVVDRVADPGHVMLLVGRGGFRAALAAGAGTATVLATYLRGPTMDETLGDDATVDVAVAVGDVRLSLRALLELRPGQVLDLGRPLGSAVELRVGPRVVARGELVDVDGELGVRVLATEP